MIESTSCDGVSAGRSTSATVANDCGFTASTRACAPVTSCGSPWPAVAPFAATTASRRASSISLTTIDAAGTAPLSARADTTAPPIAPAPMTVTRSLTGRDLEEESTLAILPADWPGTAQRRTSMIPRSARTRALPMS